MTTDITKVRAVLVAEREKLVHQLLELGATESGDLTGDVDYGDGFADAASATAERTEALVLVETLKHTLDEVDSAMQHLENGTYGVCDSCGKDIGATRMEARPSSTKCVECKSLNR